MSVGVIIAVGTLIAIWSVFLADLICGVLYVKKSDVVVIIITALWVITLLLGYKGMIEVIIAFIILKFIITGIMAILNIVKN